MHTGGQHTQRTLRHGGFPQDGHPCPGFEGVLCGKAGINIGPEEERLQTQPCSGASRPHRANAAPAEGDRAGTGAPAWTCAPLLLKTALCCCRHQMCFRFAFNTLEARDRIQALTNRLPPAICFQHPGCSSEH